MTPLGDEAKPWSKAESLKRGERRTKRQVAGPKRWREIVAKKQGPCRVCGKPPPNELHHLIARSQGGADCEGNIAALCSACHAKIEARDPVAGLALAVALDDLSYAYVVERFGESFFERRLNIIYERA